MELQEFKSRLKDGRLGGTFLFAGSEDYLKRYYLSALRAAVGIDGDFAAFNYVKYDGQEVSVSSLREDIISPPMMSDRKLIEWKYPGFDKMKESDLKELESLVDLVTEYDYVTLAFLASDGEVDLGTAKRPGKFSRRFGESIGILNFEKSTDAQLITWLKKHFDKEGVGVTRELLELLLFRVGHSMSVLNEEVTKLCMLSRARGLSAITAREIEEATSSTPECDTFALSNAVLSRDKRMALHSLDEMKSRRVEPTVIIGMLARTYSELVEVVLMLADGMGYADIQAATGMNAYKLRHYVSAAPKFKPERVCRILEELTRVDIGAKYGGVTGYTAIELFITKCV